MSPRRVDKKLRRERVLTAAARVFAEYGYRQATIDQVAEAAGVAKGSVYLSFDSKEDLFYGVLEDFTRDFVGDELDLEDPPSGPVLDRLEDTLYRITRAVEEDCSAIPLTVEFWAACGAEETRDRFGPRYARMIDDFRSRILALLQQGRDLGEVRADAPVEALASCIVALVDGLLIQQWTVPGFSASTTLRTALPMLLLALRTE